MATGQPRSSEQRGWRVCIRTGADARDPTNIVGTGISLGDGSVLTCAHVVGADRSAELFVDFPEAPDLAPFPATVPDDGSWFPETADGCGDLAVLDLAGSVPGWRAPLHRSPIRWRQPVGAFGYPEGVEPGLWIEATLLGGCGPGGEWVQMNTYSDVWRVREGFSGAGVIDIETGHVVGMIVRGYSDPSAGLAWMIPVETIISYLPRLEARVAGTSAVDPVFAETAPNPPGDVQLAKQIVAWCQGRGPDVLELVLGDEQAPAFHALRRVVALADRRSRPRDRAHGVSHTVVPPAGSIDLAIDARGKSVTEIERRVRERVRGDASTLNVVIVGVDLARHPGELLEKVLNPLVEHGVRLLLGYRDPGTVLRVDRRESALPSISSAEGHWVGADLVPLPVLEFSDPAGRLLDDPVVPESARFCLSCGRRVGRGDERNAPATEGECPNCRTPFSFTPKLRPGQVVEQRYRVLGCLARGGMGWVFLAVDVRLGDQYVVLKGLFSAHNERARQLAATERRALIELNHPSIVRIIGFVRHPDPTSEEDVEYIVLEYVEGLSLHELVARPGRLGPLDDSLLIEHVLAYCCEILDALEYLHGRGFLFGDVKPHNVLRRRDGIALIDLGGVRRIGDRTTAVVRTERYSVPAKEIEHYGLSVHSDLYALGQALDELFRATADGWRERNIAKSHVEPGIQSFHRLVRRATDRDPGRRFQSAAEMARQVRGVLREILSLRDRVPRPAPSELFTSTAVLVDGRLGTVPPLRYWTDARAGEPDAPAFTPTPGQIVASLPAPRPFSDDPAANVLAELDETDPESLLHKLRKVRAESVEVHLRACRAHIELGQLDLAASCVEKANGILAHRASYDWRLEWHWALVALADHRVAEAQVRFDAVHGALPGEDVPKLALGLCAEHEGDLGRARPLCEAVWLRDNTQVNAAFGLARVYLARGDRWEAVRILDDIPATSRHYDAASVAAIRVLSTRGSATGPPGEAEFRAVIQRLRDLRTDADSRARLTALVRETALDWVRRRRPYFDGAEVLGRPVSERSVRALLERSYRALAGQARSADEHQALIDLANARRPRTPW